jgi:hypothetical protein
MFYRTYYIKGLLLLEPHIGDIEDEQFRRTQQLRAELLNSHKPFR